MTGYLRNRKKSAPTTKLMSLLLAFTLVASLFSTIAPTSASAAGSDANVGGTGPASGNATSRTPAGTFQVSDNIAVLQFGFIPNKVNSKGEMVLSTSSGVPDLEDPFKFNYESLMFYMAPSKISDTLWHKQGSGLISFERGQGVRTLYGSNPLYPGIQPDNDRADLMKRTLDYADQARAKTSNINYFEQIIADTLYNIDPSDSSRSLSGEGNVKVIGDSLKGMIEAYILRHGSQDAGEQLNAQIIGSLMFSGYLDLIKSKGVKTGDEYTAFEQMMRDKFKKGELIFFAQTVIGISVQDGGNPQARDYAFMPMHDATDWYLNTRQSARPTDNVLKGLTANKEFEAVSLGGATSADQASLSPYKENGNIPFSFRTYARDYYARTLKPVTESVPMSSDYKVNGFGGWGFQPWGYGDNETGNKPAITAELDVTVVDKDGNPTNESFTVPIKGWTEESEKYLNELESNDDTVIIGGMSVEHDGKSYDLVPNENATFTLVDIKDDENINKLQLTKDALGEDGVIPVPVDSNSSTWEIRLGYDTPLPLDLNKYLGGDASSGSSSVENKYEGTGKFSNAQVTLFVQAREDDPNNEKVESNLEVPQWRLSKYWDDISPSAKTPATFNLSLPIETFRNPSLSPKGVTFSLLNPDLSKTPWAISRAKLFNDTPYRSFSPYNTSAKFNLAGDLLAIKDNGSISNNKFASWVNNITLFDNRIGSTSTGSPIGQATVEKDFLFQYGVKSGVDPFRYTEDKRVPVGSQCSELFGCWTIWGWEPRTANATSNYDTADYDTTVTFQRYIPKDSAAPKVFENASESVNGKYWETNQSEDNLNVNPEVLMAYDDQSGNTSVAFVAGDKLRPIKPVSYNVAQFVNVDVLPTVTGMSTATDSNAKQLAKSLNAPDKEVLYKGSAVTTNFEVRGQLELKTFALDIGNSAFKSTWNPSSSYSTDAINEAFLSKYASKDETTGKWKAILNADGKLVISGKEYGGKQGQVTAEQSSESVNTYILEVRGGKLIGVNGNRNLNNLPTEIKEALTRMHILADDNVFNVFEHGTGAKLSEDIVATLGNMVRGSNELAVGKGFYNEDSTSLIVREYITTFDLPSYMTADKVPMEIPGLEVQMDKNQLFSNGATGHTLLQYKVGNAEMIADSSKGDFGVKKSAQFVVGNASVLDSFSSQ